MVGTNQANTRVPDTHTGGLDNAWLGQHHRPTEHELSIHTIEMGARPYIPALGRFTSVDPVLAGADNDYAYVNDPINKFDLDGHGWWGDRWNDVKKAGSAVWEGSGKAAEWLTESKWGKRIETACNYAWGQIAAGCAVVYAVAYLRQGKYKKAAAVGIGFLGGNKVATKSMRFFERSQGFTSRAHRKAWQKSRTGRFYRHYSNQKGNLTGQVVQGMIGE